jgi:long-chain acyl-CoA synthetase
VYTIERYTIPEIVEKSSRRYFERPALSMVDGEAVYFRELEPRTRRIAAFLGLLGVKKGDRVAILSENRPEWGLSYFGISRSGAVAVPIMVDFLPEQISTILEHSESRVLIVSKRLVGKISGEGDRRILVCLDDFSILAAPGGAEATASLVSEGAVDRATSYFAPPDIRADDLASILYTSGTMGKSKGAMLTHRNLVFDAVAARRFILLRRTDRLLSILPLAHSYEFTIGFLIPIIQGSAVYYLDRPPSATALLPALAAIRPTIMLSVPLVIEKIYHSSIKPALDKIGLYKVPLFRRPLEWIAGLKLKKTFGGKIRFFGIGGAPLSAEVETFLNHAGFLFSIGYGLTETAPLLAGNRPGKVKLHTTGIPASGVELRIADARPDTGEGEIQARGLNVFPGYYKDPERSAEAFSADGWFRTGDLGVMDRAGRVTVKGRLKTMILGASGENIYPEEIEAVLNASPDVLESLVYGDERGLTALVHLKPEVAERFSARVKDELEGAEVAAANLATAAQHAAQHAAHYAAEKAGVSLEGAERSLTQVLERIKREANARLAGFSRLAKVEQQVEPFEKTPKQSIKRFLYPRKNRD